MAMQMQQAFDAQFLTPMAYYHNGGGTYDDDNVWVPEVMIESVVIGVIKPGNKFSQFEEGKALQAMDGGARYSDFKTLYITNQYDVKVDDYVGYRSEYFNILQTSDYNEFGFHEFLLEKAKNWSPT